MSISFRNTVNTGIHGPSTGQDPIEACLPTANAFWAGLQPFGYIAGIQDQQGTFGLSANKWRNADWVTTAIGTGGAPSADLIAADGHPSTATIITDNAVDGDGWGIQWSHDGGTTVHECFLPTAGQLIVCYGRFKIGDAAATVNNSRFYFGLSDINTDIHATDDDLIMFHKASGAATMVGRLAKASTATDTSALANSLVDDTYIALGFRVNGVSSVEFWQGTTFANMTRAATQTTMTNIADEALALSYTVETSTTSAQTSTLQHMVAFQEAL